MTIPVADDVVIHRVGGADVANLRLSELDAAATPPGLSVLAGGSPQDAAGRMRTVFRSKKWRTVTTVASATVAAIRAAGFDVITAATHSLPNHHRIIHPNGVAGFTDDQLAALSAVFQATTGC